MIAEEPVRGGYPDAALLSLSGIDRLRAGIEGRGFPPPPIHHLFGLTPTDVGHGSAVFRMPASPWLEAHSRFFTGGVLALAADAALGGAVLSVLGPGEGLATSNLSLNYLRPAGVWSKELVARGRLVHRARTVGLSEVAVEDATGTLLAHGTSRCFVHQLAEPDEPVEIPPLEVPAYSGADPYQRPVEGVVLDEGFWQTSSGDDFLRGVVAGEIGCPPISRLIGHVPVGISDGAVRWRLPASEWLCAPEGRVYGGVTALFLHDALVIAVHRLLPPGTAYATLDLSVNFLRPVAGDGRDLEATAEVLHRGRTMAVAAARATNADGKAVATATGTVMILPGRGWPKAPGPPDD